MSKKQYRVNFTERIYIGGMDFTNGGQIGADTIIECLEYVAKHAMTMSSFDCGAYSAWTKKKECGKYIDRLDYRGDVGMLAMDQHNPAVLTLRGSFGGLAQSDKHVSPSIGIDICFGAPSGSGITDLDAYHVLTWLYTRNYNVYYRRLPSDRAFYREINVHEKNNAGGLTFPPSFKI